MKVMHPQLAHFRLFCDVCYALSPECLLEAETGDLAISSVPALRAWRAFYTVYSNRLLDGAPPLPPHCWPMSLHTCPQCPSERLPRLAENMRAYLEAERRGMYARGRQAWCQHTWTTWTGQAGLQTSCFKCGTPKASDPSQPLSFWKKLSIRFLRACR